MQHPKQTSTRLLSSDCRMWYSRPCNPNGIPCRLKAGASKQVTVHTEVKAPVRACILCSTHAVSLNACVWQRLLLRCAMAHICPSSRNCPIKHARQTLPLAHRCVPVRFPSLHFLQPPLNPSRCGVALFSDVVAVQGRTGGTRLPFTPATKQWLHHKTQHAHLTNV